MINPIGSVPYTYPVGVSAVGYPVSPVSRVNAITPLGVNSSLTVDKAKGIECQTCKTRKYVDVSNEGDVSYQSPTHISPSSSYAKVSSHEAEHVSNAVSEGNKPGNQLVSSNVSIKMAVCPECGTPYAAGGTTRTTMQYNESNPYERSRKSAEAGLLRGMNFDAVA